MEHNMIAYHPIRVSPHASLFLPYSEQELKLYHFESLNTLRLSSCSSNATNKNNERRWNTGAAAGSQLGDATRQNSARDSNSPPGYTTPSPFSIPLQPSSSHTYPSNELRPISDISSPANEPPRLSSGATNVHQPTSESLQTHSHAVGPGSPDHANKRCRYNPSSDHPSPPDTKISISETVAQHYNSRPNLTKGARTESPIYGLRKLNNWIKSVIIGKFASVESKIMAPLLRYQNKNHIYYQQQRPSRTKVLELGCGKGGDLAKWQNAGVGELYGFDIARVSVEQAQSRYMQGCQNKFFAKFYALDCFSLPITSVLGPDELREPFHAVSLQFCMHYAFESEAKVRTMMENVSKFLIPGGVMIGTIPDPDFLLDNWERCSIESDQAQPNFGNSIYRITFPYRLDSRQQVFDQIYGNQYRYYLQDAVEDVPEYLVLWEPFVEMAREYGLRLLYKQGFHQLVQAEKSEPNFKRLMSRMNLIDSDRSLLISEAHWEASGIYLAFAFIKD